MVTATLHFHEVEIGKIFTPLKWAEWLILKWGIFDAWLRGCSICDPTAGEGSFALALFEIAKLRGINITDSLVSQLTLVDICPNNLESFRKKALRNYGINFPLSNLVTQDIITDLLPIKYDILVGNPPWANFADLPSEYKERIKQFFVAEGLVPDKKQVLLGTSRVDIAALVLKVVLGKLLNKGGIGCFFLPISLFCGDDAHRGFRNYKANDRFFSVEEVYEFTITKVFDEVSTSYCCAFFRMDTEQSFPVRFFRESPSGWSQCIAIPLKKPDDPWRIIENNEKVDFDVPISVELTQYQKPRQGVNTCGANKVFIFDTKPDYLPDEYLYPLVTKEIWNVNTLVPKKWILLPYNPNTGKPLTWYEIRKIDKLADYLMGVKRILESRKGTLIRSYINKGIWWALLGVGTYSFTPYKIIWEAYGKNDFRPIIISNFEGKVWQANQAMHAFIPCWNKSEAERIHGALLNPSILPLLRQLNGGGKCNWAQPGKIKKILTYEIPCNFQQVLFGERKFKYRTK